MTLAIPEGFARATLNREGETGTLWLESLPSLFEQLLAHWQLSQDGAAMFGYLGVVVPVKRDGEALALKLCWPDPANEHVALALKTWKGQGGVKLIEADLERSALLLERLDSSRSLETVPVDQALDIASAIYQRLCVPAPQALPKQEEMVEQMVVTMKSRWEKLAKPFPMSWLDRACSVALELAKPENPMLVNYDLHPGNILASSREPWLAIDPKGVAADREFGIAQMFWYHLNLKEKSLICQRLDRFIELCRLDDIKAYTWTFVRCLDYWLWGLGVGLTDDPLRCKALSEELESRLD